MTTIFYLWYRHGDRIGGAHTMVLGTYTTEARAKDALAFLSDKPGFVDYGIGGFTIDPRQVDMTSMPGGPVGSERVLRQGKSFWDLWHRREDERGYDHDTLIGIYSSEAEAQQGLAMVRSLPEFSDFPEGFEIGEVTLDRTEMREGFVTVYPGDEF